MNKNKNCDLLLGKHSKEYFKIEIVRRNFELAICYLMFVKRI